MASFPGHRLEDYVQDVFDFLATEEDEYKATVRALEPWRLDIEASLARFDPDELSWRDYRDQVYNGLPEEAVKAVAKASYEAKQLQDAEPDVKPEKKLGLSKFTLDIPPQWIIEMSKKKEEAGGCISVGGLAVRVERAGLLSPREVAGQLAERIERIIAQLPPIEEMSPEEARLWDAQIDRLALARKRYAEWREDPSSPATK